MAIEGGTMYDRGSQPVFNTALKVKETFELEFVPYSPRCAQNNFRDVPAYCRRISAHWSLKSGAYHALSRVIGR